MRPAMKMSDTRAGYGWISIALHWITAIIVLTIWFVGSSIQTADGMSQSTLRLHTSIAISAYVLLWFRIAWRFVKGHPGPLVKQQGFFYLVGKYVHYVLLICIGIQLVTGPLMVWSMGDSIHVFDWFQIPGPYGMNMGLLDTTHFIHVWSARAIIIGTILHLGGVYKHAAFNQDGTFGKMLIPWADAQQPSPAFDRRAADDDMAASAGTPAETFKNRA
jgi:cytochrome b561